MLSIERSQKENNLSGRVMKELRAKCEKVTFHQEKHKIRTGIKGEQKEFQGTFQIYLAELANVKKQWYEYVRVHFQKCFYDLSQSLGC